MARPLKKVFLSSTGRDLAEYREAVAQAIDKLDGFDCVRMEDTGARTKDADTLSLERVAESDVFVALLGHLYGTVPAGRERSITEREYEVAIEIGLPRLVFVATEDFKLPKSLWKEATAQEEEVERFHARVKEDLVVGSFSFGQGAPQELAGSVTAALANWAAEEARQQRSASALKRAPRRSQDVPDLASIRRRYLDAAHDLFRWNPFKGLDRKGEHVFPLLDLYVDLKVLPRAGKDGDGASKGLRQRPPQPGMAELELGRDGRERQTALGLLQENDGVVLLGHPGAGKTTFLKVLVLQVATGRGEELGLGPNRLPILIPVSDFAAALQAGQSLDDYVVASCRKAFGDQPFDRLIKGSLESGEALVLLDGLDEVRDADVQREVLNKIKRFYSYWRKAGNKFVLTSRIEGYADLRFHGDGLVEGTLADFDEDEIREFAGRWVRAVETALRGTAEAARWVAEQEEEGLVAAIFASPALRELASNPLLLTILAIMKRQEVTLPEQRALLYQRYVEVLLQEWNKVRSVAERPVATLSAAKLLDVLSPLAFSIQQKSAGLGLLQAKDLRTWLEDHFRPLAGADAPSKAQELLDELRLTSLLSERGPGLYGFLHRTFQEFLAARALAKMGQTGVSQVGQTMLRWLGEDKWREVFRLTIGYMGVVEGRPKAVEDLIEMLLEAPEERRLEAAILAGDGLADLGEAGVRAEVRDRVAGALQAALRDGDGIAALDRARAGRSLGGLRDPLRPEVTTLAGMQFCWVPAGPFVMGSGESGEEQPQHEVEIPYGYWLGRYPVTVAQFREYCEAAGAPPEDPDSLRGLWNGPVAWVSWHDALRFCGWLSGRGQEEGWLPEGWRVSVPSEAEWEKGARGGLRLPASPVVAGWEGLSAGGPVASRSNPSPDRRYPWGSEADPNRASYNETGIGGPSAVGCFPGGVSPLGCEELSGNVWEWTRSLWGQDWGKPAFVYPYRVEDGREDFEAGDETLRVLRGGSYFNDSGRVRCACRFRYGPNDLFDRVGFRVVVRPFFPVP